MCFTLLSVAIVGFFACSSHNSEPLAPPVRVWTANFGNLHAYSQVLDGVDTPEQVFTDAWHTGRVHFLCLTEHNHEVTHAKLSELTTAATAETQAGFVALQGLEYSNLPPGRYHINVYHVGQPIPGEGRPTTGGSSWSTSW